MTRRKGTPPPPPPVNHLKRIIEHLVRHGPCTLQAVGTALSLATMTVRNAVGKQRTERPGEVFHIIEWVPAGTKNNHSAVYAYGPGDDAPRPHRQTPPKKVILPPEREEPLHIPETEFHTRFANDINPWTGKRIEV